MAILHRFHAIQFVLVGLLWPSFLLAQVTIDFGTPGAPSTPLTKSAQISNQHQVLVKIHAALVDGDLNVKPVPKLTCLVKSLEKPEPISVVTSFEGTAEVAVDAGEIQLSTPHSVQFQGKRYSWNLHVHVGEAGQTIELSNDNAEVQADNATPVARKTDELASLFKQLSPSVVTVWSEFGHGTGFIVDSRGLVITNQHVVGPSEYLAVQFDEQTKLPAVLLTADAEKDIAILWTNLSGAHDFTVAPIRIGNDGSVIEGERVFTIGSPLSQRKILTTGVVSKVEKHAIMSDININHGNSGGPLFNSLGNVVGLTTFGARDAQGGPGLSGIIRIEDALPLLSEAQNKIQSAAPPPAIKLPVEASVSFPISAIKASLSEEKFKADPYLFGMGDYEVAMITPILQYRMQGESSVAAAREKAKRNRKHSEAVKNTFEPLDDLKSWAEYLGEYRPVLIIRARPKLEETVGSALLRGFTNYATAAKLRYKADFYKMKLFCGDKEVQPIHPGKIAHVVDVQNRFINATDATYEGLYTYSFDAISSSCGTVSLEIYSERNPSSAKVKHLDGKTVLRVSEDFVPLKRQPQ